MTDQEFITRYKQRTDKLTPEFKKDHWADTSGIGCTWGGERIIIPLDVCLKRKAVSASGSAEAPRAERRRTIANFKVLDKLET